MHSGVTNRFVKCHNYLIEKGIARNSSAIARDLGIHRQFLNRVVKGDSDATVAMLQKMTELYYINPSYLMLNDGEMTYNPHKTKAHDNITFLPVKAYAGYSEQCQEPVYVEGLEKFSLPIHTFDDGEYRCFEIDGESMEPNFYSKEYVVCSSMYIVYLDRLIKNDQVYVVVTESDVLLKRLTNLIAKEGIVKLSSDNPSYTDIILKAEEIKEIWRVEMKLSPIAVLNKLTKSNEATGALSDIQQQLAIQAKQMQELQAKLAEMV